MAISRERGIVLVIVLWIVALLSMMAASFAYFIRIETTVAARGSEQAQGRALAEAGVHYALMQLLSPTVAEQWPVDGSEREVEWGEGKVLVKVVKASGMIDLNKAKRELLEGVLAAGGVEEDALDSLLDAIEDWRDPNDETRLNGAERDDYLAAGYRFGPKNAPFESVEELLQVLGMTPAVYDRIASRLTVFSRQTGIDPALATADVLKSIPGVDPEEIDAYVAERRESFAQGLDAPPPPEGLEAYLSSGPELTYHIGAKAILKSGVSISVEAVVFLTRQPDRPFQLRMWREG
jgi:general secretion pathway protein K